MASVHFTLSFIRRNSANPTSPLADLNRKIHHHVGKMVIAHRLKGSRCKTSIASWGQIGQCQRFLNLLMPCMRSSLKTLMPRILWILMPWSGIRFCLRWCKWGFQHDIKDRWHLILPDYKKVNDYHSRMIINSKDYWLLSARDHVIQRLPRFFSKEINERIDKFLGQGSLCLRST